MYLECLWVLEALFQCDSTLWPDKPLKLVSDKVRKPSDQKGNEHDSEMGKQIILVTDIHLILKSSFNFYVFKQIIIHGNTHLKHSLILRVIKKVTYKYILIAIKPSVSNAPQWKILFALTLHIEKNRLEVVQETWLRAIWL